MQSQETVMKAQTHNGCSENMYASLDNLQAQKVFMKAQKTFPQAQKLNTGSQNIYASLENMQALKTFWQAQKHNACLKNM